MSECPILRGSVDAGNMFGDRRKKKEERKKERKKGRGGGTVVSGVVGWVV